MNTDLIEFYKRQFYKGIFDFKEAIHGSLKFYYASYFLQKNKHKRKIDDYQFVYNTIKITERLKSGLIWYSFIPSIQHYRHELGILAEIIKKYHLDLVEMFRNGNVNDESIDKLIESFYSNNNKELQLVANYNLIINNYYTFNYVINNTTQIDESYIKEANNKELRKKEILAKVKSKAHEIFKNSRRKKSDVCRLGSYLFKTGFLDKESSAEKMINALASFLDIELKPKSYRTQISNPGEVDANNENPETVYLVLYDFMIFFEKIGFNEALSFIKEDIEKVKTQKK